MSDKSNTDYKEDILEHLRDTNALPARVREIESGAVAIQQAMDRAAIEISILRRALNALRHDPITEGLTAHYRAAAKRNGHLDPIAIADAALSRKTDA